MGLRALGLAVLCPALFAWTDPVGDTHELSIPPVLDVVGLVVTVHPDRLDITISLDPGTTGPGDVDQLAAFIDFDSDQDFNTGRLSHIEENQWEPFPLVGADFFVLVTPIDPLTGAVVFRIEGGVEVPVGLFPVTTDGLVVQATIPRCYVP